MRLAFIIVESHLSKREEIQDRSMSNLGAQVNGCIMQPIYLEWFRYSIQVTPPARPV